MVETQGELFHKNHNMPMATKTDCTPLEMLHLIHKAYHAGLFGGTTHEVFPDIDKRSYLWRIYFTLPCSINYQRKSESLWNAALKTFNDPETEFVFNCKNVTLGTNIYRSALVKHKLAVQPEKQTNIWFTISNTLEKYSGGDPLSLFEQCDYDIFNIKKYIVSKKREFPYLSGPKLLNYWLYMVDYFTKMPFKNRSEISVIPDLHVKRATVALGLIEPKEAENTTKVAELWYKFLRGTEFAPCDLHAPLWRWSRAKLPNADWIISQLQLNQTDNSSS